MKQLDEDRQFILFCERLEELKGTVPTYQPSERWLEQLLRTIQLTRG